MVDDPSHPGLEWLSAEAIATRAGGQITANTVRSWWTGGNLPFQTFPELGKKSNKRSHRTHVDAYLRLKGIQPRPEPAEADGPERAPGAPSAAEQIPGPPRLADVLDALVSVKAAADTAIEMLVEDTEQRLQAYKKLRSMIHSYDMALSVLTQPSTPPAPSQANPRS
ncbi:hypothetical protein P5V83_23915 [Mycobacteroides abscessus subsp. abscessus]|uniref:hypothetical protein n=1 Tax=Mycobacteroides abscessus TaxID=36809 RepID=UPI00266D6FAC|nr:hypothetical protein [Mycobacteroides abscessus]MDO3002860.1 hypothetical protein [Mycobacteroides abscessus subsp. abscessus]MDO3199264.1 hypothetical protein [Mycobacteroides abscessus subsp. abscessus]MDO3282797.1 hypothetical protein [Mycobacteroides abscessus subsp. abscessus]